MPYAINIDTILSDPFLAVAAALLVLSPIVFLVAFWKFVTHPKESAQPDFHIPDLEEPAFEAGNTAPEHFSPPPASPVPEADAAVEPPPPAGTAPNNQPNARARAADAAERTVVMTPGVAEIQGQLEIAFSQLKTMNRKLQTLETEMESLSRKAALRLEPNELREPPTNPADFSQKLLKLAEHVIILEKEVARMRGTGSAPASAPASTPSAPSGQTKPPIMPI